MSDNSPGFANQQSSPNGLEAKCSTSLRFAYLTQLHIGAFDLLQAVVVFCCFWVFEVARVERFISIFPSLGCCYGFQKICVFGGKTKSAGEISAGFLGFEASTKVVSSLIFESS